MVSRPRPHRLAPLLVALAIALGPIPSASQPAPTEYQLKAVFLYSFTKYVRWPDRGAEEREEPLHLCVLGRDPFGALLDDAIAGETVRGRPLAARRLSSVEGADGCHVLFVSRSASTGLTEVLAALDGKSVLTVGESERFAEDGGIIAMTEQANRIGIVINRGAAKRAGLTISSQLLKLGKIVGGTDEQP